MRAPPDSRPKRPSTWRLALLLAPFAFAGGAVADHVALAQTATPAGAYPQLDLFARVLAYVENNYVEPVSDTRLIYGAIEGMVGTLDPHSLFMPPKVFRDMKVDTSGEFGGLGLEVAVKNAVLTVVTPIDDTPASRAGIQPGDALLAIDGAPTKDLGLAGSIEKLRGPPGSKAVLTLMRPGFQRPRDFTLLRERIRIVSVTSRMVEGYGYVKIKSFQDRTDRYLAAALDGLRAQSHAKLKGLVLDLRNNPGGLLDQAVRVSDRFLTGGQVIVTTKGRGGKDMDVEKSHDRDTEPDYPMVVLVNAGSASASEIVAGALQDNGRAEILGTQTFGKGSVQTIIELDDGSGLKLTIAKYYTPKGRSIQELGITPDERVKEGGGADDAGPREVDLKGHFKNDGPAVKTASATAVAVPALSPPAHPADKLAAEDFQLKAAIDYLKTWPHPPVPAAPAVAHP